MRPPRPALRKLADRLGILPKYVDQRGRVIHTRESAREAMLVVMGFDAPTEDAARGWLAELDHEARSAILAPVRVVERDDPAARQLRVQLPPGSAAADVDLVIEEETGHVWRVRASVDRGPAATLPVPTRLPYGYHRVTARVRARGEEWAAEQALIVCPSSCVTPDQLLRARRGMGVVANLYAVRREHDWGVGDLTSLLMLAEWAGSRGAAFVGVNPLHALYNRGHDVSPYSPVTRLFRNPLYIDVDAVPEMEGAGADGARALLNDAGTRERLRALRDAPLVDYDGVIELKLRVLAELHRAFRTHGRGSRTEAFEAFVRVREPELTRFATWMAIAESARMPDWRQWPAELHDPASPGVRAWQQAHAERVDFHRWLQFEAHRQLGVAAERAQTLGMDVGLYQDLAIGTSRGGSDTWGETELFLTGASVGAPPDPYSATGQNWGLPPMNPRVLRQQCYRYWVQLLRRAFEHSGALRVDHVMGLFRSFWVPEGGTGLDGAYVRFPSADLLGILALESVRHNALVVGEDLGTVPREVPPALRRWGILSSKVLYFERTARTYRPGAKYPELSLATANTHDLPTLAGFWAARDIELRSQVGLLPTADDVEREEAQRAHDRKALLRLLRMRPPHAYEMLRFSRMLARAVHDFLCATPAKLVGVSLDDLTGEVDPVNLPGVGQDGYSSWRRRLRMTLEEMSWSFEVDEAMGCDARRKRA